MRKPPSLASSRLYDRPADAGGGDTAVQASAVRPDRTSVNLKLFPEPAADPATPASVTGKRPIAVIGAGFSGTIATLQLLRRLPPDQPVLLCERSPDFARGVAYATGDRDHLLNVRAANMSALSDEPLHFQEWLKRRAESGAGASLQDGGLGDGLYHTDVGVFASRGLYGQYLRSILDFAMRETAGHAQLRLLPDEVLDVVAADHGGYELVCASGLRLTVAGVVLAVGNLPPEESDSPRICRNAWSEKAWRPLSPDKPVLIVGTGLTMIDLAITLRRRGFTGGLLAMSRGGLLPTRHAAAGAWPTPHFTLAEERSLPRLMARLREEVRAASAQGVDWRAVIDSMRPVTASIWGRLPLPERRRFLRHARRYWDVHRHRMAPPHADMIESMLADGSLRILAGRIRAMEESGDVIEVRYAPRAEAAPAGGAAEERLQVQRVIMASGLEHISRTRDPLMQRLLDRGLVRVDRQGLGIDVSDGLNAVRGDGSAAERIWALGPIVRGVFWECVAVPDIRVQAAHVAVSVVARLREDAPRWSFII
jgi:uncharacterized NAD(P)/FAD-binding protein YdhS